jgi:hypothetical protein
MLSFMGDFLNFDLKCIARCRSKLFIAPNKQIQTKTKTTSEEQMKFNKWTLGLAAVGVVSLASAVRADEAKMSQLQTALSNTTISGYVDVAAQYNTGNQHFFGAQPAGTGLNNLSAPLKVDAFSLNDVDVAIDKPEDDSPWASGYHVDLNWGSDAIDGLAGLGTTALGTAAGGSVNPTAQGAQQFGVRQAYIVIRTPVGNGIDWKVGVQDDIIGYEGNTDGGNPNYTRSYGYFLEPTTLTGIVGTYKISDMLTVQAGVADATSGNNVAGPGHFSISEKTFVGAVAFTAPDSWGFMKGATANAGAVMNFDDGGQCNYYGGITVPTPWSMLKVGASFDLASIANSTANGAGNNNNDSGWVAAFYANVQATDKLSFNGRAEYFNLDGGLDPYNGAFTDGKGEEITLTAQYNLWANVISRVEFRWDHADTGRAFNGSANVPPVVTGAPSNSDSFLLAANLIYTF